MERYVLKTIIGLGLILMFFIPPRKDLDRNQVIFTSALIIGMCILVNKEK
jgi:hypothetical protein